jgi:uncharacterized integral membrane protein (TIGR00697 family)
MNSPSFDRRQRLYLWLAGLFVAALLTGDLIGGKVFRVGHTDLGVGMLLFPLTFVLTDILNEFYGPVGARRVTFVGLGTALFAFAAIKLAIALPTSPESPLDGPTFERVFGLSQRTYIASLTAYVVGQMLDIVVFAALRRVTKHRMLWLRATGSTLVSQLVDTVVVTFVFYTGLKPMGFMVTMARDSYLLKVVIAIGLTPVIYGVHALLLRVVKIEELKEPSPFQDRV